MSKDTSRITKNPLLSSAVTDVSLEDISQYGAILLPAAPPPVIVPEITGSFLHTTVSKEPATLNLENFSEVSLDSAIEDTFLGQSSKIVEEKITSDVNDLFYNAPAALTNSLAQLPNVASTVFTTFSNIIKGSPRIEQQQQQQQSTELNDGFSIPRNNPIDYNIYAPTAPPEEPAVIQPPPTFYSATDSLGPKRPEIPTGNNSYRLTNVKKTYAKIPGLFTGGVIPDKIESVPIPPQQQQQQIPDLNRPSEYNYDSYKQTPSQPQESGKFSLSTFFPTGIIDKLQQTVYGESNPTDTLDTSVANYPPPPQQVQGYFEGSSNIQGFFGGNQIVPPPTPPRQTTPFEVQSIPPFVQKFQQEPPKQTTPFENQSAFVQQPPITPFGIHQTNYTAPEIPNNISAPPSIPVRAPPPTLPLTGDRQNPYSIRGKKTLFNKNPHIETSAQPFSELLSTPVVNNPVNFFNPCPEIDQKPEVQNFNISSNFFTPIESVFNSEEESVLKKEPDFNEESNFTEVEQFSEFPGLSSTTSFNTNFVSPINSEVQSNFFNPSESVKEDSFSNFFRPIVQSESIKDVEQLSEFPGISSDNSFNSNLISPNNSKEVQGNFCSPSESDFQPTTFNNFFKPIVESEIVDAETFIPEVEQFSAFPGLSSRNSFASNLISEIGDTVTSEVISDNISEEADTLNLLQQTSSILQHDLNKDQQINDTSTNLFQQSTITEPPSPQQPTFNLFSTPTPTQTEAASTTSNINEKTTINPISFFQTESSTSTETQTITNPSTPTTNVDSLIDYDMLSDLDLNITETTEIMVYRPVYKHWFYTSGKDTNVVWKPFTMSDSFALEEALTSGENNNQVVATDGGRFDVNIIERTRDPVFWPGDQSMVRRCSWFFKGIDSRFVPYEEATSDLLEEEYAASAQSASWHKKVVLPTGETVVFHGPSIMVHYLQTQLLENGEIKTSKSSERPRVVKRGVDEFDIDDGEPEQVDHLMFMVHGIGAACDLKFRTVEEVVDEFRSISTQLIQSHYRASCDQNKVGRIEVLPISWHAELHSEETGIDEKLKAITLESIPKLRSFTNDTLLDVLFYTSPFFCQSIMNTVGDSLNRLYNLFCSRNPNFKGKVSLGGHSLGSLIMFDLLYHQKKSESSATAEEPKPMYEYSESQETAKKVHYNVGTAGTGHPHIIYPQLNFQPSKFFALGSPIGMFVTIRGIERLGLEFELPTCDNFYNIFHPYDPVAYRIESLVNPNLSTLRPVLIPHHKGRKRMHLELRETVLRVGESLKQKLTNTYKTTMETVSSFTHLNKSDSNEIQEEVDKLLDTNLANEKSNVYRNGSISSNPGTVDIVETDIPLGCLNKSKRIDYVLQEAPLEFFNEYIFALTSHVCYWESEDSILFMVKEIYSGMGIETDNQIPQHSMIIERPIL